MVWVDRPQNYKGLYGILQLLKGSHLDNFPLKTLKLLNGVAKEIPAPEYLKDYVTEHWFRFSFPSYPLRTVKNKLILFEPVFSI